METFGQNLGEVARPTPNNVVVYSRTYGWPIS
jgi:hypothetical protein